ncbi:hypothetical protein MPSEU_000323500 [Mayamaea pseudoterrestris]|nr:hypothetical protein MPSEU_000323500 [Mayamaea pseudoterrestris]
MTSTTAEQETLTMTSISDIKSQDVSDADQETTQIDETKSSFDNDETDVEVSCCRRFVNRLLAIYWSNEFLFLVVLSILLARAYPPLGAVYLAPDYTASWIAVIFIFLLSGLNLKTQEFKNAFKQVYFNAYVQCYNFGVVSAIVFGVSRALAKPNVLTQDLADGMVICASLPMAINLVTVLTKAGGGDEAASIFNSAFASLIGVFLCPALILGYLGTQGSIDLVDVFYKLAIKVLLPVTIGQILQKTSKRVMAFVVKHKKYFGMAQQYFLTFIIYTVFCTTFMNGSRQGIGNIFLLIVFIFLLLVTLTAGAWFSLRFLFRDQPKLVVMGVFGCTHKTIAIGVPLINAIYQGNPSIGLLTLPLLVWHPMQVMIGSLIVTRLQAYVKRETIRLNLESDSDNAIDQQQGKATVDVETGHVERDEAVIAEQSSKQSAERPTEGSVTTLEGAAVHVGGNGHTM